MQETSQPAIADLPRTGSLVDHLAGNAAASPRMTTVRRKRSAGSWRDVTFDQLYDEVRQVAKGIAAAGVQPGDRVGIMSSNRYECTVADYAIWCCGAVAVPIFETSPAEQVEWILSDSGAVALFLGGAAQESVFHEVAAALPNVQRGWVFDADVLDDLAEAGEVVGDDDLDDRRATLGPDSIATIIYTPGTTGLPKGCTLTHGNLMHQVDSVVRALPGLFSPDSSALLVVPLAHVFGLVGQLGCIRSGATLGHSSDVQDIAGDLAGFQPSFLLTDPRVVEEIYNGARHKAHSEGRGRIFDMAATTAIDYSRAVDAGGPGTGLRVKHELFDRLVYGHLRAALGGRATHAVSAGAALGSMLGHFFRGIGMTVLEGYGLAETTGAATWNRPGAVRIGSVGQPIPGTSVRIANDGEVLLRGPQIFAGYWGNETATKEVLQADGWLHSGDIGELDADGFLRITGRKEELIVTASGKSVAPAVLEDRLRSSSLVSRCMVVGDGRPHLAALVTIDPEPFSAWLAARGRPADLAIAALVDDPDLLAEIQAAVDDANNAVSRTEAIKRFAVLSDNWTIDAGHLAPSMALRRSVVLADFCAEVEALYA